MSVSATNAMAQSAAAESGARRERLPFAIRLTLGAIRWYQAVLSPLLWSACRYYPSCSHYACQAIEKYGIARGTWLGWKRLLRCHPFARHSGYDPVPEREELSPSESARAAHEVHL